MGFSLTVLAGLFVSGLLDDFAGGLVLARLELVMVGSR